MTSWALPRLCVPLLTTAVALLPRVAQADDQANFERLRDHTRVVSAGYAAGSYAVIRVGDLTFYHERLRDRTAAGLYVVAIRKDELVLRAHYNTLDDDDAARRFADDIDGLRDGTFVVVAAKDEPTRRFSKSGQEALHTLGARTGLLDQRYRSSYLCIGMKGMQPGQAVEQVGMQLASYYGERMDEPLEIEHDEGDVLGVRTTPGVHEGLLVGRTEVLYYIPQDFNPRTAEYLFGIHGAGDWHRPGALTLLAQFREVADRENLVVLAPSFDAIFERPIDRREDMDERGRLKDPRLMRERFLTYFQVLLNKDNAQRSDLALLEVFAYFNEHLMRRKKFHLYGHSGGGQFVNRFALFHAELLDKVAQSAAGTYTFPARDQPYPWGLDTSDLDAYFGDQVDSSGIKLSAEELDTKLNRMLDLQLFIIVGAKDTEPDGRARQREIGWQGINHIEKARNYFDAMREEHRRLVQSGKRRSSKRYRFELHVLDDVGHDSGSGAPKAIELMFPEK